ncbi:46c81247-bbb5-4121-9623-8632333c0cc1 [Thermothielavioides terrestris]|uniref:46c81247-bbb5-4121-9623-8632333c0cc1 n=1 Tax=Thermothielavioides terrestris TaxID=2587410 RepID=A0A3S4BHZ3_9PEZI|nr:46c81247-bbb5-4121-9623-8632333c0cc1 [Thermothielavioides terrestris]
MGLPYSKQIHHAFDQVTPLVVAGFRVLETSRDIAILVALIQVVTCLLLAVILLAALALLITVNPDLEPERQAIVTPVIRWLASWVSSSEDRKWLELVVFVVLGGVFLGSWAGYYVMQDPVVIQEERIGDAVADQLAEETEPGAA